MELPVPLVANSAPIALLGGLALLYAAGRAVLEGLVAADEVSPGRRAVAQAIPIFVAAVAAAVMGRGEVALGIAMGTAVASASLAAGVVEVLSPGQLVGPTWGALWRAMLPAAVLTLIIGFSGHIDALRGGLLAVEGVVLWLLWMDRTSDAPVVGIGNYGRRRRTAQQWMLLALGVGIALVGALLAIRGADLARVRVPGLTGGVAAAAILAPGLVLPLLGDAARLAEEGRGAEARTTQIGVVLLNLCGLVPLIVLIGYFAPEIASWSGVEAVAATMPATGPATGPVAGGVKSGGPTPFPMAVWRVDSVVLTVLGLWLFPISLGKWSSTKAEGILLIVIYAAYLMAVAGFHG